MRFLLCLRRLVFMSGVIALVVSVEALGQVSAGIRVAGSDLLKGRCAAVLQKSAAKIPGGLELTLDGSLMAEKYLRLGRVDAALLVIAHGQQAKVPEIASGEWVALPIGFQSAVLVVNQLNRLEQMDFEMIAGIYGEFQVTDVRHWSKVEGSGLEMPVFAFMARSADGLSVPLFRSSVLRGGEFRRETAFRNSSSEVEAEVSANINAIGCLSMPPVQGRVRVLALAREKGASAYLPTPENLYNGDYLLAVPAYLVFPVRNRARLDMLLPVLFGADMAQALTESNFTPAPKNIRENYIRGLDKKK
ncbi:MAG: hypothetical protein LBS59_01630 [Puniceicoccales bacterium]|nr:hypothetical protein [Puniceicoccales bacterium]